MTVWIGGWTKGPLGSSWWFGFLRGIEVTQNGFFSILDAAGVVWVLKNFESVPLRPKLYISEVKVTQSCPTLCGPMDYTVHGILQARIRECVAFPFSRGPSQPRDWTQVSHIAGRFFTSWATREAQEYWSGYPILTPADLPHLGIKLGSPALQVDSLLTELSGKP